MTDETAGHRPHYRPLAGDDDVTCARCYASWPCSFAGTAAPELEVIDGTDDCPDDCMADHRGEE